MENLPVNNGNGQSFGYTLYETAISSPGILRGLVRDRGQVGASLHPCACAGGIGLTIPLPPLSPPFALTCPAGTGAWRWALAVWPLPLPGRGPAASSLLTAHDASRLSVWQVFVNTVYLGFLGYERKEIFIPLIQVCVQGSWAVGRASLLLHRGGGPQRGRPGNQVLLNQSCGWRVGTEPGILIGRGTSMLVLAAQEGTEFCRVKRLSSLKPVWLSG